MVHLCTQSSLKNTNIFNINFVEFVLTLSQIFLTNIYTHKKTAHLFKETIHFILLLVAYFQGNTSH